MNPLVSVAMLPSEGLVETLGVHYTAMPCVSCVSKWRQLYSQFNSFSAHFFSLAGAIFGDVGE